MDITGLLVAIVVRGLLYFCCYFAPIGIYGLVYFTRQKRVLDAVEKGQVSEATKKTKHKLWRTLVWNTKLYYNAQTRPGIVQKLATDRFAVQMAQLGSVVFLEMVVFRLLPWWLARIPVTIMAGAANSYIMLVYEDQPDTPAIPAVQQIHAIKALVEFIEDLHYFQEQVWSTFPLPELPKDPAAYKPFKEGQLIVDNSIDFQLFLKLQPGSHPVLRNRVCYIGGGTMLHWCAYYKGDMQQLLTQYLLQKNANLACRDDFGNTPLHYAVVNDNVPYMKIICNILHRVSQQNPKQIHLLTMPNRYGITPLHCAVALGRYEIASLLVQVGAEVNFRDNLSRSTPLTLAMSNFLSDVDSPRLHSVLLRGNNLNPFKPDRRGLDALMIALMRKDEGLLEKLLKAASSLDPRKDCEYDEKNQTLPYACKLQPGHVCVAVAACYPRAVSQLLGGNEQLLKECGERSLQISYSRASRRYGIGFQPEDINVADYAALWLLIQLQALQEQPLNHVQVVSATYLQYVQQDLRQQDDFGTIGNVASLLACVQHLVDLKLGILQLAYDDLKAVATEIAGDVDQDGNQTAVGKLAQQTVDMLGKLARCNTCRQYGLLKKCSSCKQVAYCSKACQVDDWPDHRAECVKAADGNNEGA